LGEPESSPLCSLEDVELVPQGENLELQRRASAHGDANGVKQRHQDGQHRREAYPRTPATSTIAIGHRVFSSHSVRSYTSELDREGRSWKKYREALDPVYGAADGFVSARQAAAASTRPANGAPESAIGI
jgi:hypothetical protein